MAEKYICLNGSYVKVDKPLLEIQNRSFLYGDGIFETIHANGTEPQFIERHLNRMLGSMRILKMVIPDFFTTEYFTSHIKGVLTRNKQFQGARIRITVFRNGGGRYAPEVNEASFVIESSPLDSATYQLNQKGYRVDVFEDMTKPIHPLSGIKTTSALLLVLAGVFRTEKMLDDCLLLNQNNRICESLSSNLFLVKGNKYYTPSLKEGCLPGIMRQVIIGMIRKESLYLNDDCSLTVEDLFNSDEIFLTNSISGIRWVVAFRQKRYFNKSSKFLIKMLNEKAFGI
ncbi:MAG: aminotransferase class IV family protein [Bacteroidales bacterium]|nr:aminotransferase class IV family protein [Bacteroidales bacterium]